MTDLISRQAAIDAVHKTVGKFIPILMVSEENALLDCVREINQLPSVDAVEAVRCKDCKYKPVGTGCNHDLEFPVHYKCPCECEDYWYSWMPKDDFFCGNGERKTDETD